MTGGYKNSPDERRARATKVWLWRDGQRKKGKCAWCKNSIDREGQRNRPPSLCSACLEKKRACPSQKVQP